MKPLGIVRKLDPLGRIVIPKEIRKTQGWDADQPLEMFMTENGLLIRSYSSNLHTEEVIRSLCVYENSTDNAEAREVLQAAIKLIRAGYVSAGEKKD
ncbi:AbrB family looped-hinge helix DNA binding protein [Bacillus thermophilus]|uniref:AbrB family looped-hinge helix DNA binding protein n=1 Tax=Siminovitchia thermophila TaxID=1245522 RepID=A0ABS2RBZ0_9BACI|nr:AbrB/MazE/SpoVT family DNA-binding domain-containing protein [Siminovitchia thermophila]MBM7717173.1 AbrB family looped-hinge helix DNA binding protein [Siminovitchia thermophila]